MAKNRQPKVRNNTKTPSKTKVRNERYQAYQKYIRSKQFKEVKKIVYDRDGAECCTCCRKRSDGVNLTVHHKTYKHLFEGGEIEANDCCVLCTCCHRAIHSSKKNYQWFSMEHPRNNKEDKEEDKDE